MEEKTESSEIPEATKEISKSINPIEKDTVNKICSGQVVVKLSIAVKELVENAIDAGATLIEIKLKNQGLDYIEVSDNGVGVDELNLEGLTAKYCTSKIKKFTDLIGVESFGFRGEALSSLCTLSDMVITTKHESSETGVRLELDHEGKILKKTYSARPTGTSVTISNLFNTIPVRRKEFEKTIKKQFTEMCQILQAYCLVSKGIKIICTNQNNRGSRTTLMSTQGSDSVLDNIISVFGSKQKTDIIEIQPSIKENEKFSKEAFVDLKDLSQSNVLEINENDIDQLNMGKFKFEGWISSCSHGCGRSVKDRQYLYFNSRPCDSKNISKLINEIYHRYNVQQYPFFYLNIIVDREDVDVNLTPDKRQLLINNEKLLLLTIKKSLLNTYESIPSTYKVQNSTLYDNFVKESEDTKTVENEINDTDLIASSQKFMQSLSQWKATGSTIGANKVKIINVDKRKSEDEVSVRTSKLRKIQEFLSQPVLTNQFQPVTSVNKNKKKKSCESESDEDYQEESADDSISEMSFNLDKVQKQLNDFDKIMEIKIDDSNLSDTKKKEKVNENRTSIINNTSPIIQSPTILKASEGDFLINCKNIEKNKNSKLYMEKYTSPTSMEPDSKFDNFQSKHSQNDINQLNIEVDENDSEVVLEAKARIEISLNEIRNLVVKEDELKLNNKYRLKLDRLKFKTQIDPNKNQNAEEELDREISKIMFKKMEIIGQFNLGFIIARLDSDLFIIDQHATDEKYNFEILQKTTKIEYQKLAIPERLDLTAVDEIVLIDKLHVFESNGFKFEIDHDAPPTRKVKLLGKPYSKNWQFDKDDIADLIFMLQDAPEDTICRPSKIRQMFASRACRKSVMIGTSLTKSLMKKLVQHMGEIDHPWNCPHGRPTMRHLINLSMLREDDTN